MGAISERLAELRIVLPEAPKPVASYVPGVRSGNLLFVSGQLPFAGIGADRRLLATGPVPSETSIDHARVAARQCVLNGLAVANHLLNGDLDRIHRVVRLGVWVCSDARFTEQPKVANGASDVLVEIFGERGRHARAAVSSVALPLGATVEVEMLLELVK